MFALASRQQVHLTAPRRERTRITVAECGPEQPACFIYLDDGLFTGNTILNDLAEWLKGPAPKEAYVHVIVMALHRGGPVLRTDFPCETCETSGQRNQISVVAHCRAGGSEDLHQGFRCASANQNTR
jgi:hypothetical protein